MFVKKKELSKEAPGALWLLARCLSMLACLLIAAFPLLLTSMSLWHNVQKKMKLILSTFCHKPVFFCPVRVKGGLSLLHFLNFSPTTDVHSCYVLCGWELDWQPGGSNCMWVPVVLNQHMAHLNIKIGHVFIGHHKKMLPMKLLILTQLFWRTR